MGVSALLDMISMMNETLFVIMREVLMIQCEVQKHNIILWYNIITTVKNCKKMLIGKKIGK